MEVGGIGPRLALWLKCDGFFQFTPVAHFAFQNDLVPAEDIQRSKLD